MKTLEVRPGSRMASTEMRCSISNDGCIAEKCASVQHGNKLVAIATTRYKEEQIVAYMKMLCNNCGRVCDGIGRTALHMASSCGHCNVARWLICNKAAVINFKDLESGYTSLHRALFYGQIHVAVTLLKYGASTTIKDKEGLMPFDIIMKDKQYCLLNLDTHFSDVYVWGSNSNYNLGTGKQQSRSQPEALESLRKQHFKIKQVLMEKFHSLFISTDGKVFSCGHGHGGRLGLGMEQAALIPTQVHFHTHRYQPSECDEKIKCTMASIGQNHSVFGTEGGVVWTCGMNEHYQLGHSPPPPYALSPRALPAQSLKVLGSNILGVCAAQYHTVIWGKKTLLSFGTNAGQLGHGKSSDPAVILPREVVTLRGKGNILKVAVSDGAIVVALEHTINTLETVIYLIHEFTCRRVTTRYSAVVQLQVIGGNLDESIIPKGQKQSAQRTEQRHPRLLMLDSKGDLFFWEEGIITEIVRCSYALGRAIHITAFAASINEGLLLSTNEGEAFEGKIKVHSSEPPNVKIKLKRIPNVHRAVSVACDPEGRNFAVLQVSPAASVNIMPKIAKTEMKKNMKTFLEDTREDDSFHDVIFQVGNVYFPAHKFITASKSDLIKGLIAEHYDTGSNVLELKLNCIEPEVFKELLHFMYSNDCTFTQKGSCSSKLMALVSQEGNESSHSRKIQSAYKKEKGHAFHSSQEKCGLKPKNNPVEFALQAAKQFEITSLINELEKLRYEHGKIFSLHKELPEMQPVFRRSHLPELHDIKLCSMDGIVLQAHRCILCARSQYFRNMLCGSWVEANCDASSDRTIKLPAYADVLEVLLDFFYEDEPEKLLTSCDADFIANILALADQICENRLKNLAEYTLAKLVTIQNVGKFFQLSEIYSAEYLKLFCMQFIAYNMAAVLENRSLNVVSSSLLQILSEHYISTIHAMSCRMITPNSNAPDEDEVKMVCEAFPVTFSDTGESEVKYDYGVMPKKKITIGKKKSSMRKCSTEKASSRKLLSISFTKVYKEEQEGESSTVLASQQDDPRCRIFSADADIYSEAKSVSKKQQSILQARLKVASVAKDIEPMPESFTKLMPQSRGQQTASINVENLHDFPELQSPSPSPPRFTRIYYPIKFEKPHKVSQKQRKKLAATGSFKGSVAESEEEHTHTSASPLEPVQSDVTSTVDIKGSGGYRKIHRNSGYYTDSSLSISPPASSRPGRSHALSPDTATNVWAHGSAVTGDRSDEPDISFSDIIADQKREKENLSRMLHKSLEAIQIEERAIKELCAFYNADGASDEKITVHRVPKKEMAKPMWQTTQH